MTRSPNDPRVRSTHRERGPGIILRATWADIARLLGVSVHTAKKLGCGARRRFNPRDLGDVVRFAREYGVAAEIRATLPPSCTGETRALDPADEETRALDPADDVHAGRSPF